MTKVGKKQLSHLEVLSQLLLEKKIGRNNLKTIFTLFSSFETSSMGLPRAKQSELSCPSFQAGVRAVGIHRLDFSRNAALDLRTIRCGIEMSWK